MENTNTSRKGLYMIGAVVVVILIVVIALSSGSKPSVSPVTASSTDSMTATSTVAASSTPVMTSAAVYSVVIEKSAYSQNQTFPILVSVMNETDHDMTLKFPNGCQGNYIIGSFDLSQHVRCTPEPTSFVVPAHKEEVVKMVHYPTVYKIPVGTYTLKANIVGYGGSSVPLTITE